MVYWSKKLKVPVEKKRKKKRKRNPSYDSNEKGHEEVHDLSAFRVPPRVVYHHC